MTAYRPAPRPTRGGRERMRTTGSREQQQEDGKRMTLTGPDRDEVFNWDPSEPELMKAMIMAGVQIQIPIGKSENGELIFPKREDSMKAGVQEP